MEKTEEVLRKQLIDAMEDGKYRILLHRTYTKGDDLSTDGITKSICTTGLKIFGDTHIDFSTSDYGNEIDTIMGQIKCAYTYKASDKVFILKVPINALEYTPGDNKPLLYEINESNQLGKKCFVILPQYILGYVDVSKDEVSELHLNNSQKIEKPKNLQYTSSITAQYRKKYAQILENIRSDRLYTQDEKRDFLKILYANYGNKENMSEKLKKQIRRLIPQAELEAKIIPTPLNMDHMTIVDRFYKRCQGENITVRTIKDEFGTPRRINPQEIMYAIPSLINRENEKGNPLTLEEMIDEISKVHGFDKYIMARASLPKINTWQKLMNKLKGKSKQKLLEESKTPNIQDNKRERFIKDLKITGQKEMTNQQVINKRRTS